MSEQTATTPPVHLPRTAMIGVGSMGGAILNGLLAPQVSIEHPILVTTRSNASAAAYDDVAAVQALSAESDAAANATAVAEARIVVLGVKPWLIREVAAEIAPHLASGTVVVSVAAGVPCAAIEELLPAGTAVVRAMPNTPAQIGLGVTGIAPGAAAQETDLALVAELFATVGEVLTVREDQINDIAAVSGSGPAYVFLYAEEMLAAAERRGFSATQAETLVRQTIVGAAQLWQHSGEDPAELRRKVTSPKGTTERAIEVLQADDWGSLFDAALAANVRRSEELEAQ